MSISIITPSYGQLDWLKLCVASVADQVGAGCESRNVKGAVADANIEYQEARCSLRSSPKDEAVRRRRGNQRPGKQTQRRRVFVTNGNTSLETSPLEGVVMTHY